ncbi:zymogen granule membrane protein 16-like [Dromiciops gliroides]|uniref:zymogen granule membrane protein 16-like n=1 Tax=Dromiciops gliroides TaxID=33562 RepID=UPI001CC69370|nr:zymogen granule membrane protein 16-like [Dromiciops gliroides]
MLLLILSLVLLGGSANGVQQSQSQSFVEQEEGTNFIFSKEGQEINGVRVLVATSGYLSSIQIRYGTTWSERYGSTSGSPQEVTLNPDEFIVKVTGSNGNTKCLQHLTFVTDQGRKLEFGKVGSNQFTAFSTEDGKALSSIFGRYDSACLTGFAFDWVLKVKTKKENLKSQQSSSQLLIQKSSRKQLMGQPSDKALRGMSSSQLLSQQVSRQQLTRQSSNQLLRGMSSSQLLSQQAYRQQLTSQPSSEQQSSNVPSRKG